MKPQQLEPSGLERTGGRTGWRISAVVVALVLLAVVALGRWGMEPAQPAAPLPSPVVVAPATPTPPAAPATTPLASPPASGPPSGPGPAGPARPLATRYADGIPTSFGGERVLRLPNVLAATRSGPFLVGGWYLGPDCGGLGHGGSCPLARFADTPAGVARRTASLELERLVEPGSGARILRASLDPACVGASCRNPRLRVEGVVWSGDPLTESGPIGVVPLLSALAFAFPQLQPGPFNELPQCPVPWPPQSYRSSDGGPRMTLIFPTVRDRLDAQAAIRAGRSLLLAEQGGECLDRPGHFRGNSRWIARENVMLLLEPAEQTLALAEAAMTDALEQTPDTAGRAGRPITTWQALRRLWRVEPTLDLVPGRQLCGEGVPADTFALRHPQLRVLAVFPSRAERRAFQRRVQAGTLGWSESGCDSAGRRAADSAARPRWIAHANVLLEFAGPAWLEAAVRQALRGTGTP